MACAEPPALAALLADLATAMDGGLTRFAGSLVGPHDTRASMDGGQLLDVLCPRAGQEMWRQGGPGPIDASAPDRRAVISEWTLTYFEAVLPPLLSAAILLGRSPCVGLDRISFILTPDQRLAALQVFHIQPPGTGGAFDGLVAEHLTPLIDRVAARGRVTARVLWNNAGHVFEAFIGMLEPVAARRPGSAARLEKARALLANSAGADGGRNPLFQPVRYEGGQRIRRVCCLRVLVPHWRVCAICPLDIDNPLRVRRPAATGPYRR